MINPLSLVIKKMVVLRISPPNHSDEGRKEFGMYLEQALGQVERGVLKFVEELSNLFSVAFVPAEEEEHLCRVCRVHYAWKNFHTVPLNMDEIWKLPAVTWHKVFVEFNYRHLIKEAGALTPEGNLDLEHEYFQSIDPKERIFGVWVEETSPRHAWICNFRRYSWAWTRSENGEYGYQMNLYGSVPTASTLDCVLAYTLGENLYNVPLRILRGPESRNALQALLNEAENYEASQK